MEEFFDGACGSLPEDLIHTILNQNLDFPQADEPYLEILRQPKQRGYRFRYSSEGNTHGGIPAVCSEKGQKTFPTVQIANYSGKAAICVSLVTVDDPPRVHAHNLVGKDTSNGLFYIEDTKKSWTHSFQNLGIQHVTKKDLITVLHNKLCQQYQLTLIPQTKPDEAFQSFDIAALVDSFGAVDGPSTIFDEPMAKLVENEKKQLYAEAEKLAKSIDLSAVRLCFQAFLPDESEKLTRSLPPVYSVPIYDQKAAHAGQLRICRISSSSSSVNGDEEVFLLCDKVQKDDIAVQFFTEEEGKITWEGFGKFSHSDVHKQCAIVFRTPPYIDKAIQRPVDVFVRLRRGKDNEFSPAIPFTYKPETFDKYKIGEKRRKGLPEDLDQLLASAGVAKQPKQSESATVSPYSQLDQLSSNSPRNFASESSAAASAGIRFFNPGESRR